MAPRPRRLWLLLLVAFVARAENAPRKTGGALKKEQCAAVCGRLLQCLNLSPEESSTLAELDICVGDCLFETKDQARRPGWRCALEAKDCESLRQCSAGARRTPAKPPIKK
jgi:hypothetical protein